LRLDKSARWIDGKFVNQSARVKSMNKGELVDAVAAAAGLSRADAGKAVDATLEAVTKTLRNGGSVSLVGFGTFSVKARAARMGRNPRTGEAIQIAASNVPGFKAGKGLKDAVN
jgi:DNA-binding protein HU-beta